MTVTLEDPAINKVCEVKEFDPYPHIRTVVVPGAGDWIRYEFPKVLVEEALKWVAELHAV